MNSNARHDIRRLRHALGETQEAFGHRFRVTRYTINRWECGRNTPPWWVEDMLRQLRATLYPKRS